MCILNYQKTFTDYIDNVSAYVHRVYLLNPYTGEQSEPDERLMRSIEEKADISEPMADDFRCQIAAIIGNMIFKSKVINYNSSPRFLAKAIENYTKQISHLVGILPFDLSWKSDIVYKIADNIVKENKWGDLPILADALEDANCACQIRLNHLRTIDKNLTADIDYTKLNDKITWCSVVEEILGAG